jgi:hypothetical protein
MDRKKRLFGKAEGGQSSYIARLSMLRARSAAVDHIVADAHRKLPLGSEPIEELPEDAELSDHERRIAIERERFNRERRARRK